MSNQQPNESSPSAPKRLSLRANFSWTFIGNIVNSASWFGMTIVLAQLGTTEDVGQFALGLAVTAPIFMFATLRLRDVQATDTEQEYRFGDYFALRITTTILSMLVVAGIVVLSGFERETALVILAVGTAKAVEAISDVFYGLFIQQERMDRSARSMIMKGPLTLLGLGVGFYLTDSVFWAAMGLALARLVILLGFDIPNGAYSLRPSSKFLTNMLPNMWPRPRWAFKTMGKLVWLTLPLGFVTMLISYKTNVPRYFVESYLGIGQLGIFAAVANFQKAASTFIMALGRSASPRLARFYAANNAPAFRKLLIKLVGISILLAGAGILAVFIAGDWLLALVYGPEYVIPGLFILIMVASGIEYIATMLQFGMTAARYFRVQLPVFLFTVAGVALASYIFIPTAGLKGGAIAIIIASIIRTIGSLAAVWHALYSLRKKPGAAETVAEAEISSR